MRINIVTIFPGFFTAPLSLSIPGRAREAGAVEYRVVDLRDFTHDRHRTVDDVPYGGGAGMVTSGGFMDSYNRLACNNPIPKASRMFRIATMARG
jgi:tRNA (guanine37-N1)-methyltransferase